MCPKRLTTKAPESQSVTLYFPTEKIERSSNLLPKSRTVEAIPIHNVKENDKRDFLPLTGQLLGDFKCDQAASRPSSEIVRAFGLNFPDRLNVIGGDVRHGIVSRQGVGFGQAEAEKRLLGIQSLGQLTKKRARVDAEEGRPMAVGFDSGDAGRALGI